MNSLQRKGVDIIRRPIYEPALAAGNHWPLVLRKLRVQGPEASLAGINDWQSLNHS